MLLIDLFLFSSARSLAQQQLKHTVEKCKGLSPVKTGSTWSCRFSWEMGSLRKP